MAKKLFNFFSNLFLAFLICIGILVLLSSSKVPGGLELFTVMSGSMEPALHTGSVIFVKPSSNYAVGDIVTRTTDDPKVTITHRIATITNIDGQNVFKTKGDANNAVDTEEFSQEKIIGKEFFTIPFLGYITNYTKTKQGMILLIVIPAIIIIYDELGNITKEIAKIRAQKLAKKRAKLFP